MVCPCCGNDDGVCTACEAALAESTKGNGHFSTGDFAAALTCYSTALALLRGGELCGRCAERECTLRCNRVAARLSLRKQAGLEVDAEAALADAARALQLCTAAALDGGKTRKAQVRMGEALLEAGMPSEALQHFAAAERLDTERQFAKAAAAYRQRVADRWQRHDYAAAVSGRPVRVACAGGMGKGLTAAQFIPQGAVVFEEPAHLGLQQAANTALVQTCAACFRVIGTSKQQLAMLLTTADAALPKLPFLKKYWPLDYRRKPVHCDACGIVPYCSPACRQSDWHDQHALLCLGARSPLQIACWMQFVKLAQDSSCSRLFLAAQLYARVLTRFRAFFHNQSSSSSHSSTSQSSHISQSSHTSQSTISSIPFSLDDDEVTMSPAQQTLTIERQLAQIELDMARTRDDSELEALFCRWNGCMVALSYAAPPSLPTADPLLQLSVQSAAWRHALQPFQNYARGSWRRLRAAEAADREAPDALQRRLFSVVREAQLRLWLFFRCNDDDEQNAREEALLKDVDALDYVLGVFSLNDATFEIDHPVRQYLQRLGADLPRHLQPAANAVLQPLLRRINELHPAGDIGVHGEALYALHACLNHSCRPNVKQVPGTVDGRVVLRALRDIAEGEPLEISYIDLPQPLHQRRDNLLNTFGFHCQCTLCHQEIGDAQ